MASVKKRKDSPYWIICYKLPNGKRKQVSSGLADKSTAMQMALKMESLASGWSQAKALALVDELGQMHGESIVDQTPVKAWMAHWRESRESDWAESSRKSFRAIEKAFCSQYGDIALGKLGKPHVVQYRDALYRSGRARRTVQSHVKYLRRVFATAIEYGKMHENPAKISLLTPKPSVKRPFSLEQFKALLNATEGEWHLLILIAGLTGQRLRDCLELTHEQIDGETNSIRFRRHKNKDWHVVPLHPAIKKGLTADYGPVLPEMTTWPMTGANSVSARFRDQILTRIGIVQPYGKDLGGNKTVTEYSFHSLRHMLSTELNRAGVSPETRRAILGHDDAAVSAAYTHVDFAAAGSALAMITI